MDEPDPLLIDPSTVMPQLVPLHLARSYAASSSTLSNMSLLVGLFGGSVVSVLVSGTVPTASPQREVFWASAAVAVCLALLWAKQTLQTASKEKELTESVSVPRFAHRAAETGPKATRVSPPGRIATAPPEVQTLFGELNQEISALGQVECYETGFYIGYRVGSGKKTRTLMSVKPQTDALLLYFPLSVDDAHRLRVTNVRDVSEVGHHGVGNTLFKLSSSRQIPAAMRLASEANRRLLLTVSSEGTSSDRRGDELLPAALFGDDSAELR
jgi:predicted transport protein